MHKQKLQFTLGIREITNSHVQERAQPLHGMPKSRIILIPLPNVVRKQLCHLVHPYKKYLCKLNMYGKPWNPKTPKNIASVKNDKETNIKICMGNTKIIV